MPRLCHRYCMDVSPGWIWDQWVTKLCNMCIKQLLGVSTSTCNDDMCYIELGYPSLKDLVLSKQKKTSLGSFGKNDNLWQMILWHIHNKHSSYARYNTRTFVSQTKMTFLLPWKLLSMICLCPILNAELLIRRLTPA